MQRVGAHSDQTTRLKQHSRVLFIFSATMLFVLCALAGGLILNMRENAWSQVARSSETLLRSIERTLDRDIELYDLSLQAVIEGLQNPHLEGASPEIRHLALFDRAAKAQGFGSIFVLDEQGRAFIDSDSVVPRVLNASDRPYFQIHRTRDDVGLYIGRPMTSAVSGNVVIPMSRRVTYADGSFAGVVIGTLQVAYFAKIFERLNTEPGTAINLFHANGTLLVRTPAGTLTPGQDLSAVPSIQRYMKEQSGQHRARSVMDGIERFYTFARVGNWPLRVNVAVDVEEIDAVWRSRAIALGVIVLMMCGGIGVLALWLRGELNRRMEAEKAALLANTELTRLANTDSLTGLANRRRFDEALSDAHSGLATTPTALLLLDTDQFKRYNDIYGHPAGDQVLKAVARILQRHIPGDRDFACRIGGEEFAVLLTGTDEAGATACAERIRKAVAAKSIPHAGHEYGIVTISVGVMHLHHRADMTADQWFALTDAALYKAKRHGRNQVRTANAKLDESGTQVA